MELTGGADCGATGGDEESERVEEDVASGGNVRVERWVRHRGKHRNAAKRNEMGSSLWIRALGCDTNLHLSW